jgi:tRNA(Ile)-lysidine synthase
MRRQVWPSLTAAFAQAESALSEAARWAQDAQRLAQEVGEQDVQACRRACGALDLRVWGGLSPARARNALREWFRAEAGQSMPASLFKRLLGELAGTGAARWPAPGGELMRYRQALSFRPAQAPAEAGPVGPSAKAQDAGKREANTVHREEQASHAAALSISRCGRYPVPAWQGELVVRRAKAGEPGVPLALLSDLRPQRRQGREQFQLGPLRPARSLKKQFQALGVPEPQRTGPLLWAGPLLVFVPGLGLDARVWAPSGPGRVTLEWRPLA